MKPSNLVGASVALGALYLTYQYTEQLNPLKTEPSPREAPLYLGPAIRRGPMGLNLASVPLTAAVVGGLYFAFR